MPIQVLDLVQQLFVLVWHPADQGVLPKLEDLRKGKQRSLDKENEREREREREHSCGLCCLSLGASLARPLTVHAFPHVLQ